MPGSINLRMEGRDKSLHPTTYISALQYFWGMLRDLDAALSRDDKGSIRWEIESLSKNSPDLITFKGHSRIEEDRLTQFKDECIIGLRQLSEGERLPNYSDAAVNKVLRLAKLRNDRKRDGLSVIQVFTDTDEVDLGPQTVEGIETLTSIRYESLGSIVGHLDSITVHRGSEFRVWGEVERRPVTCRFGADLLEQVKGSLGRRVLVYGDVRSNSRGQPTSVIAHGLDPYPEDSELPTIDQMSGIIDDLTDGVSLAEYIEDLRHG